MKRLTVFAALALFSTGAVAVDVDFSKKTGDIRPALHSSGFGPMICSCPKESIDDIKAMGFLRARTHDWALINPGQRVCDYYHIFPLVHLDAKDPKNYVFAQTDYLLKRTREETGLDIFFRLGTSIEHSGPKVHFNSLIPEDFEKTAETFAATVRHYNKGWANGFNWGIKYWEIWNEPDGHNNMWCLPDGDAGKGKAEIRRDKFVKFFVIVLKRLKSEFPDIKVGGPALCWMNSEYFKVLLSACKEAGVAPDFISWHYYGANPAALLKAADDARKICDSFGFTECELINNEWHFLGCKWGELRSPDPEIRKRVWEGPEGHNSIKSACFTLSVLSALQTSRFDQAFYYGCRHTGAWGYMDEHRVKNKNFYALKLFGGIMKRYTEICGSKNKGTVRTFAVKAADGSKALLVVDYGGKGRKIEVEVAGAASVKKVTLLDHTHNLTAHTAVFEGGKLTLEKPDANSAAFFVEFGE